MARDPVGGWRGSMSLYTALAAEYDASFVGMAHRRAYDRLAGSFIARLLPAAAGVIVDVGSGTGRWAARWLALGHRVVGIEQAPGMLDALKRRDLGGNFSLLPAAMEAVELPPESADLVVAMGSVQYARDPAEMITRFASWTKPGGYVCAYVDSLLALALELIRTGKEDEALERLRSRRGVFRYGGHQAELHLYDKATLMADFAAAGLAEIECHGLLVSSSACGREACANAITADETRFLRFENALSAFPILADAGKHLIAAGRRPQRNQQPIGAASGTP